MLLAYFKMQTYYLRALFVPSERLQPFLLLEHWLRDKYFHETSVRLPVEGVQPCEEPSLARGRSTPHLPDGHPHAGGTSDPRRDPVSVSRPSDAVGSGDSCFSAGANSCSTRACRAEWTRQKQFIHRNQGTSLAHDLERHFFLQSSGKVIT